MITHLPDCALGKREDEVCLTPHALSDGKHHWWTGWPGAFCLSCGADDPAELCVGDGCRCECHEELWKGYYKAAKAAE